MNQLNRIEPAELVTLTPAIIESLVTSGDVASLNPAQRVEYYNYRCHMLGLDPAGQPFEYIKLNGKLVLYAKAACCQQLARSRQLTSQIVSSTVQDDLYVVQARVQSSDGRFTDNLGAAPIKGLSGEAKVNAMLKATTKALRRATLAHEGLGMLDETEIESIPAERVQRIKHEAPAEAPAPVCEGTWTEEDRAILDEYLSMMENLCAWIQEPEKYLPFETNVLAKVKAESPSKVLPWLKSILQAAETKAKNKMAAIPTDYIPDPEP